ncbi:MAG: hypothetical protein F4X44_00525 [Gammaproteobacteria bacterium]|nr:hypothetical protein [Gammaproteobacteria bacterium]
MEYGIEEIRNQNSMPVVVSHSCSIFSSNPDIGCLFNGLERIHPATRLAIALAGCFASIGVFRHTLDLQAYGQYV